MGVNITLYRFSLNSENQFSGNQHKHQNSSKALIIHLFDYQNMYMNHEFFITLSAIDKKTRNTTSQFIHNVEAWSWIT